MKTGCFTITCAKAKKKLVGEAKSLVAALLEKKSLAYSSCCQPFFLPTFGLRSMVAKQKTYVHLVKKKKPTVPNMYKKCPLERLKERLHFSVTSPSQQKMALLQQD